MMSSSSAMPLAPAHPEAAQHEPATVDEGHPQLEPLAGKKITDQRQRSDGEADHDKGMAEPQPGNDVDQHEIDRPERALLARREMAQPAAKYPECNEQQERRKPPDIEGAYTLA